MARRGSIDRGQRDDSYPSLDDLLAPAPKTPAPLTFTVNPVEVLNEIEDGRHWSPYRYSDALTTGGTPSPARRVPQRVRGLSPSIAFDNPSETIRCVRRKTRREVIFAKRKRRKGSAARRRRRNFYSNVRC